MPALHLSLEAARAVHLAAQGLLTPPSKVATKRTVLDTIRRMGALQIDSISVVARSPYLALWSRIGPYETRWLDALLKERKLFEYWAHAMCFLPIEDYGLYRRRMLDDWAKHRTWLASHADEVEVVLDRIRRKGAVRAADFPRLDGKGGPWWDWKVEKQILELLLWTGDLMIARRDNFQRVYALRERILPGWDDEATPVCERCRARDDPQGSARPRHRDGEVGAGLLLHVEEGRRVATREPGRRRRTRPRLGRGLALARLRPPGPSCPSPNAPPAAACNPP